MVKGTGYRKYLLFFVAVAGVYIVSVGMVHATIQFSDNYAIERDVLDGGGGESNSSNYNNLFSVGQSSAIGPSSSSGYTNSAGYWAAPRCFKGDVDNSRAVNILDAILALNILLELEPTPADLCVVDMDGNSNFDIVDLIEILSMSL